MVYCRFAFGLYILNDFIEIRFISGIPPIRTKPMFHSRPQVNGRNIQETISVRRFFTSIGYSGYPDSLDVDEFFDSIMRQFAPVAGTLYAAKG